MNEYPVFIPHQGEHMGAVLTLPDEEPQGLVLLLTGTGAGRSHRFQMWSRLARGLAERGLASIRMDYVGVGDSTGKVLEVPLGEGSLDEPLSALRFGMRAVGADRIAVVGNCSGSLLALGVAAEVPECVGAVCLLTRILEPTRVNRMVIGARRSRVSRLVRSNRVLSRLAQPLKGRRGRPFPMVERALPRALASGRLLFVYTREDTDSFSERGIQKLREMVASLPKELQARFELEIWPGGPMAGFESLAIQDRALDALLAWLPQCFADVDSGGASSTNTSPAAAAS